MGAVGFPINDNLRTRTISVCKEVDAPQRKLVAEHELMHICYHNHVHVFQTNAELSEHLSHRYSEEDSIEIVSQCMIDNRSTVYTLFGVSQNEH